MKPVRRREIKVSDSDVMSAFPITAVLVTGRELVEVRGPGARFTVCCHGARELARRLIAAADAGYCDGYRHGDESTMMLTGAKD